MKKFDLEAAIRGKKVVTRSGLIVENITYFENVAGSYRVIGLINFDIYRFSMTGEAYRQSSEYDLFMAPTKKKGWINIYEDRRFGRQNKFCGHDIFNSKEEAISHISSPDTTYLYSIEFEWEE